MHWQKKAIHEVPSACSRVPPVGSGALRSKTPMLSSPRKPPWKTLSPLGSFRFTHQVKLMTSFWKTCWRKREIPLPRLELFLGVDVPGGPGVHGGIDVAEVPLVGGDLAARMEVLLLQHEEELLLGEGEIGQGQGHGVEGEVPRGVPRVLPLVGHGDDVLVGHVAPGPVADVRAAGDCWGRAPARAATRRRRSRSTAWTTASRPGPAA